MTFFHGSFMTSFHPTPLIVAKVVNSTAKEATKETSKEASKEPQTPRKRTHGEAPMAELVDVQIQALLVCF